MIKYQKHCSLKKSQNLGEKKIIENRPERKIKRYIILEIQLIQYN